MPRTLQQILNRALPAALAAGREAAFRYAERHALPRLHRAFEAEKYYDRKGRLRELGSNKTGSPPQKDPRRGHESGKLGDLVGHRKTLSKRGTLRVPSVVVSLVDAASRDLRRYIDHYASQKAPGLGMLSEADIEKMKQVATKAVIDYLTSKMPPGVRIVRASSGRT